MVEACTPWEGSSLTICHLIECTRNNREENPHCKRKAETEIGEDRRCPHFKPDYQYLKTEFRKRLNIKNFEKAKDWDQREPPMKVKSEALHNSARKFLLRETEK